MSILLSHTTALEVLRRWELRGRLAKGERCAAPPPATPPTAEEVEELARCVPLVTACARPLEVLVSEGRPGVRGEVRAHLQRAPLPAGSAIEVAPGVACASPEQLAVQMAPRLTDLELEVLLSELMGTYAIFPDGEEGMFRREELLTTPERMRAHLARLGARSGTARVRRALGAACVRSASPRETKLSPRLGLRPGLGGYHLNVLSMNEPLEVRRIHDRMRRGVRVPDILVSNPATGQVSAVEYHGRHHDGPLRAAQDAARSNELKALGMSESIVRREQYADLAYLDGLVETIRRELGLPRIGLGAAERARRRELRQRLYEELELIDGVSWQGLEREARRAERAAAAGREGEELAAYESARVDVPVEAYGLQ